MSTQYEKELRERSEQLERLLANAENPPQREETLVSEIEATITVAQVLFVGKHEFMESPFAVAKDTNGKVWVLPETHGENGLVSRWDLKPGVKLTIRQRKLERIETAVFVVGAITPSLL